MPLNCLTSAQKKALAKNGFVKIPAAIPPEKVRAALAEIERIVASDHEKKIDTTGHGKYLSANVATPPIMDLLYGTALWDLGESLMGPGNVLREDHAQLMLRYPAQVSGEDTAKLHIDGLYASRESQAPIKIESFTMTLCLFLNDLKRENAGNFTISPGSHYLIAEHIRRHGARQLMGGLSKLGLPAAQQQLVNAGDVILCHYLVGHDGEQNISPNVRYALFFRLKHKDHENHQMEALTDPWLEWPGMVLYSRKTTPSKAAALVKSAGRKSAGR